MLTVKPEINNNSSPETKITLFRSLFRGREDVYAKRFENKKPESLVISLFAEMNGYRGYVRNQKSNVMVVHNVRLNQLQIKL